MIFVVVTVSVDGMTLRSDDQQTLDSPSAQLLSSCRLTEILAMRTPQSSTLRLSRIHQVHFLLLLGMCLFFLTFSRVGAITVRRCSARHAAGLIPFTAQTMGSAGPNREISPACLWEGPILSGHALVTPPLSHRALGFNCEMALYSCLAMVVLSQQAWNASPMH